MALTFYHGHGSPYSWRVFLALEHLRVPYELKVLSFSGKDTTKPEFVAINPRHQVPTITDDGFAVWESTVILEYLDERFGMDGPARLYPGTEAERATIRRLVREIELYVSREGIDPILDEYFWKGEAAPDLEKAGKAKAKLHEELVLVARSLKGKFFGGETLNAVDVTLYPLYGYIKRVTFRKPESALMELVPKELKAWAGQIETLPYFDKTFPPHWR